MAGTSATGTSAVHPKSTTTEPTFRKQQEVGSVSCDQLRPDRRLRTALTV